MGLGCEKQPEMEIIFFATTHRKPHDCSHYKIGKQQDKEQRQLWLSAMHIEGQHDDQQNAVVNR